MLAWFVSTALAAECPEWSKILEEAGVAGVTCQVAGSAWAVEASASGTTRTAFVAAPVTPAQRDELILLARSLVTPLAQVADPFAAEPSPKPAAPPAPRVPVRPEPAFVPPEPVVEVQPRADHAVTPILVMPMEAAPARSPLEVGMGGGLTAAGSTRPGPAVNAWLAHGDRIAATLELGGLPAVQILSVQDAASPGRKARLDVLTGVRWMPGHGPVRAMVGAQAGLGAHLLSLPERAVQLTPSVALSAGLRGRLSSSFALDGTVTGQADLLDAHLRVPGGTMHLDPLSLRANARLVWTTR